LCNKEFTGHWGVALLYLKKPADGAQLLRWNKKLPSASTQDPLGLNLRLSGRLATQLLYCITSITPRARYYAFFPWAFDDYAESERGKRGDRGSVRGVLVRERAMVLGAVLHHDGAACDGGALGGSDKAIELVNGRARQSYSLDPWKHLQAREGQFGAAYKASLINLGLFAHEIDEVHEEASEESKELNEEVQSIEIAELSDRGKRLADAYRRSVRTTTYIEERWTPHSVVPAAVLKEFGSRGGLCEISLKGADDRDVIKEILFSCDRKGTQSTHYRRRMSLLLLLYGIGETAKRGAGFDRLTFSDLTYFGRVVTDEERQRSAPIDMPYPLRDVAERWRMFHFHGYLTVALQSLLVSVVGILRHHPAGIDRSRLLDEFQAPALGARFRRLFKTKLPGPFFDLTPSKLLGVAGVSVADALAGRPSALGGLAIGAKFGERNLADHLTEGEADQISGIAVASMLLYAALLRYQTSVQTAYDAWYQNLVQDRFADLSVPGVLGTLRSEYGDDWWHRSNREVLNLLLWRFVLLQHQTMSYERGFGGSAPLFHIDGTTIIGTDADFSDPGALNARFFSAVQILRDLKLVAGDYDDGFRLTAAGDAWLQRLLAEETPK
jgi:hypothetical protein